MERISFRHGSVQGGPFHDEGIFVAVIILDRTHRSKPHRFVEGLGSEVAPSYLGAHASAAKEREGRFKKPSAYALSSIGRVDGHGNKMAIPGKNDVTEDPFFPLGVSFGKDEKGFGVEPAEMDKGRPVVRRLGERLTFDVENLIDIR